MTFNNTTPCLRYAITHPEPGRVEQIMAVYPDGRRELFMTTALAFEQRNRAGTFLAGADAETGRQAQEISNRLAALNTAGKPYPRGVQWTVTACGETGTARTHLLSVMEHTPLPPELQEALEMGKTWIAQASGKPYRAIEISAGLQETPRGLRLTVIFRAAGSQGIRFLLMSGGVALETDWEGARREIWQLSGRPAMGMLTIGGQLADGVILPAVLEPGAGAVLALRPGLPNHFDTTLPLRLLCWGWMDAAQPGELPHSFPDVPVWLMCPVVFAQS